MARRSFAGRSALRQGQRRQTNWVASADIVASTAITAAGVIQDQALLEASLLALGLLPSTIVRTRGELWVKGDAGAEGATENPFGAMGFAVVSERARSIGATALPFPIADEGSDLFFVHQFWHTGSVFGSAVGLNADMWNRYSFDSKAQRKVEAGNAIVIMMENASSAFGAEYVLKFRMLFKTH